MEIRALTEADDRAAFRSGDPDLDRFFWRYAGQNQWRHYVGVTYVAVESGQILGYATVAPGAVEGELLPDRVRKGLPKYPLPVLRLGRLAVDERARGKRLGEALLRFVLGLTLRMAKTYGSVGVLVDAKLNAQGFYEKFGFVRLEAVAGLSDARPGPVPMFLSARKIERAHPPDADG